MNRQFMKLCILRTSHNDISNYMPGGIFGYTVVVHEATPEWLRSSFTAHDDGLIFYQVFKGPAGKVQLHIINRDDETVRTHGLRTVVEMKSVRSAFKHLRRHFKLWQKGGC